MSRYQPTRNEVDEEALRSQRRAEAEDAYPEGQGFDAVHDWRRRQIKQITDGFNSLDEHNEDAF